MADSNNEIMVSICCVTYNHAKYIRQCLDGFLMQKTTFRYEIIINDDCSTDGTTEIIKEYVSKYPQLITPVFHDENQWSKGIRSILATFIYPIAKGKYYAICEGDDFWTDPLKLQKQVEFMEANADYSMCFHNALEHWEDGDGEDRQFSNIEDADYDAVKLTQFWVVPTASLLMKRTVVESELFYQVLKHNFIFGDTPLVLTCANLGKVRGMKDMMCTYRRHKDGLSRSFSIINYHALIDHQISLHELFKESLSGSTNNGVVNSCIDGFVFSIKNGHPDFSFIQIAIKNDRHYFFKTCLRRLLNKFFKH